MSHYQNFPSLYMPQPVLSYDSRSVVLLNVHGVQNPFDDVLVASWAVLSGMHRLAIRTGVIDHPLSARTVNQARSEDYTYLVGYITDLGILVPATQDGTLPEDIAKDAMLAAEALTNLSAP